MRVVVTGASGNVGSALLERLARDPAVESIVAVCRRPHEWRPAKTEWVYADVARDDLATTFYAADAVVHLAWLFQPTRHPETTWHNNVTGTDRVLRAVHDASVPALVVASSVGAYSPRINLDPVDEAWPTNGFPLAAYSREKALVERLLDVFEVRDPQCRVVRMRPAFTFQHRSAVQQRRLFMGPLLPRIALRPGALPVLPIPRGMRLQVVHTEDVADAYAAALFGSAAGAFNVTAQTSLGASELGRLLGARAVEVPVSAVRTGLSMAFRARLVPASPGLFDLAMRIPMMTSRRAQETLGWSPRRDSLDTFNTFLDGIADPTGGPTPPLDPATSGRLRSREVATGVGARP